MTTAPAMPEFAKTVNAVGIRSSAGFERPALNLNTINAFGLLKIVSLSPLQETAFLSYSNYRRASNPTVKTNMIKHKIANLRKTTWGGYYADTSTAVTVRGIRFDKGSRIFLGSGDDAALPDDQGVVTLSADDEIGLFSVGVENE